MALTSYWTGSLQTGGQGVPRGEEWEEREVSGVGEGNNCRGIQQPGKLEIRCDEESVHGQDKEKTGRNTDGHMWAHVSVDRWTLGPTSALLGGKGAYFLPTAVIPDILMLI